MLGRSYPAAGRSIPESQRLPRPYSDSFRCADWVKRTWFNSVRQNLLERFAVVVLWTTTSRLESSPWGLAARLTAKARRTFATKRQHQFARRRRWPDAQHVEHGQT